MAGGVSRRRFLETAAAGAAFTLGGLPVGIGRAQTASTVRFGLSSFPPNLHPYEYTGTAALSVKLTLHRGLLSYDANGNLRPELAEEWSQPDASTYRFSLRPGAVFHDGSPVEAEDVRWSFEWIAAEESTAHLRADFQAIEAIEIEDAQTLTVRLSEPSVTFAQTLASGYAPVVSRNSVAPDFIGAGPFTLGQVERGQSITVEKAPEFVREGVPVVDRIFFNAMPDENLRTAALASGDVDIIEYVSTHNMQPIEDADGTHVASVNGPFMYLVFNTTEGPTADPRVRRAIGYAIDRDALNAFGFTGMGNTIDGLPVHPNDAYDPSLVSERLVYDPERARALLAEAGAENITLELLSTAQYPQHNDTALVVQQSLAQIGISVNMNLPDWATRISEGNEGRYHIGVNGTSGAYNDPDSISTWLGGGQSPSYNRPWGYGNPRVDELLQQARQEVDTGARAELYAEIERIFIEEDLPLLPLLWRPQAYGVQDSVHDFQPLPGFLVFQTALALDGVSLG
ncbi:ABC transporter substrate-binding protein [Celeribacter indicus]|nr:ABC transporter substrate-binding protein [Celeribacter indicus]SDW09393.1 peptide/nickel transport system substrate-binding protein [Celeribacter indicus]